MQADARRRLLEARTLRPETIARAAAARRRPASMLGEEGRLMVVAADHTARGTMKAGNRPLAMIDRAELLDRLCLALSRPGVNGVLGTPDILDDLLLLGVLDDKAVFGSMNRGGLSGATFELDDRFTAYDARTIASMGFEGGKMLLRIDPGDHGTVGTLEACAHAVSDCAAHGLMAMVEPFMATRDGDGRLRTELHSEAVIRSIGISSALGTTSSHTWLKIPVVDDMPRVAASTTLPLLLLGGEVAADQAAAFAAWRAACALPNVMGLVVGRSLLYPNDDDVAGAVDAAVDLLHSPRRGRRRSARVEVTPESAGWSYCGLRVLELAAGGSEAFESGDDELVVLPLGGSCTVVCDGQRFELEGRPTVFSAVSDFAYVPRDASVEVVSEHGGRFALASARASRRLEPRYVPARDVPIELRGTGQASRQVNNFCSPEAFEADRLIAVEVLTPSGNWSSYPPHKHDVDEPGVEVALEEIYYFEVAPGPDGPGLGYQRVYGSGPGRELDVLREVRTGDVILIPHGYHGPSMAAPGYHLYYLNVMAGPGAERVWRFTDDPVHAWIRPTWEGQPVDPRLPLTTARTPV
jgi:5-deoxy-glucuronate isomerase